MFRFILKYFLNSLYQTTWTSYRGRRKYISQRAKTNHMNIHAYKW